MKCGSVILRPLLVEGEASQLMIFSPPLSPDAHPFLLNYPLSFYILFPLPLPPPLSLSISLHFSVSVCAHTPMKAHYNSHVQVRGHFHRVGTKSKTEVAGLLSKPLSLLTH